MDNTLAKLWNKLSLSEGEDSQVIVDEEWFSDTVKAGSNCLVEKLFSKHMVNLDTMHSIFSNV